MTKMLTPALQQSDNPTTGEFSNGKVLTCGPPLLRDTRVGKHCELEYNEPREIWIRKEQQQKWFCITGPNIAGWTGCGAAHWLRFERRMVIAADESVITQLFPITSHAHWLYHYFEWNCGPLCHHLQSLRCQQSELFGFTRRSQSCCVCEP